MQSPAPRSTVHFASHLHFAERLADTLDPQTFATPSSTSSPPSSSSILPLHLHLLTACLTETLPSTTPQHVLHFLTLFFFFFIIHPSFTSSILDRLTDTLRPQQLASHSPAMQALQALRIGLTLHLNFITFTLDPLLLTQQQPASHSPALRALLCLAGVVVCPLSNFRPLLHFSSEFMHTI